MREKAMSIVRNDGKWMLCTAELLCRMDGLDGYDIHCNSIL